MRAKPIDPLAQSMAQSYALLPGEGNSEYRARITREQAERQAQRQEELAQQTSLSTPYQRICLWERLHALSLPRANDHPLLDVVALQTGLSITQVVSEQQRRRVATASNG